MSFTNINDPGGVKALLDQLRSSQLWQDALTATSTQASSSAAAASNADASSCSTGVKVSVNTRPDLKEQGHRETAQSEHMDVRTDAPHTQTPSVAALLSQLQAPSYMSRPQAVVPPESQPIKLYLSQEAPSASEFSFSYTSHGPGRTSGTQSHQALPGPSHTPNQLRDLRSYTYQQSLGHIGQLAGDPSFVEAINQMKDEQNDLERKLWEERHGIQQKYDDKVKGALKKAEIIGSGISPHEAEMLQRAFRDELAKFDRERVQVAWDGLVTKQQSRLEQLRVPAMFPSSEKADIDRQRRIVQVLEGIVGGDGRT